MRQASPRQLALDLLQDVYVNDAYANIALPKLLNDSNLDSRDKAFVQELAFGTIRHALTYDRIINEVSSRPTQSIDLALLNCVRLGAHQLLGMRVPAHAAISETVSLVRKKCGEKVVGFANGVLRRISEKTREQWIDKVTEGEKNLSRLAIEYSHPEWIVSALKQALEVDGLENDLEKLLELNNQSAKVNLVALPGKARRPDNGDSTVQNRFSPIGFSIDSGRPETIEGFESGSIRAQDEGSQLAALALAYFRPVVAGESWLDMCAGPGGKAAVLAAYADINRAQLTANEVTPHRLGLVKGALSQFSNVSFSGRDGREFGSDHPNQFDRILLDAPCTGLGALRRRPEARWRRQKDDLKDLTKLQSELLESALKCLTPNGLLLYVTCSPHLQETSAQISKLTRDSSFEVLDLTSFMNEKYMADTLPKGRRTVQLHTQRDGTDSMFMALLTKRG